MATVADEASRPYMRLRAFPIWTDPTHGKSCILAHLNSTKQASTDFNFQVDLNKSHEHLSVQFRLKCAVKAAGRAVKRLFLYDIPLENLAAHTPLQYTVLDDEELGFSGVASAVRDAGFAASGNIIRVTLHLRQPGRVLSNCSPNNTIRPPTKTAHDLLVQLRSISKVLEVTFFVKHSDDVQKRLDAVCDGLCSGTFRQQHISFDSMNDVDWGEVDITGEPPPYNQLAALVPGTPDSVDRETSIVSETSIERDEGVQGAVSKRRRVSVEPTQPLLDTDKKSRSASLTAELEMLINAALPSMPPREYAEPRLQPYLDAFKVAVTDADVEAFDRAYARFTALILLDSIHHTNDDESQRPQSENDREDVARPDEKSGPKEDVASHLRRDYLNDIFVVISWSRQRSRTAVPVLWDELCALGRAAHQAVEEGTSLEKSGGCQYGRWKSKILTMSIVGL